MIGTTLIPVAALCRGFLKEAELDRSRNYSWNMLSVNLTSQNHVLELVFVHQVSLALYCPPHILTGLVCGHMFPPRREPERS